ncbi:MAG: hypothetical protein ACJA2Q_001052 [Pseudohongiellaceae bacterium]|jgi:hypothetical protein
MRILSIVIGCFVALVAGATFADAPCKTDCVTKITTDFSGRPPFKRTIEVLSAVEVAQLEIQKADSAQAIKGEWIDVTTVDYSGRPPFKRRTESLFVADVAQAELIEEEPKSKNRRRAPTGNSAQKRH